MPSDGLIRARRLRLRFVIVCLCGLCGVNGKYRKRRGSIEQKMYENQAKSIAKYSSKVITFETNVDHYPSIPAN